jgi:predicted RNase H-like nuclease (RuvC/YqgF family)
MIIPTVELDTSSQIYEVLQRLDKYDVKFAKQERTNTELQRTNEELQRTNEDLQRADEELRKTIGAQQKMTTAQQQTIAELSANVARVSHPSSLSKSQRNLVNHPS